MQIKISERQKGFTILEVTIVLALLSVGAYYLMTVIKSTLSVQKSATSVEDARTLMANIVGTLGNRQACMHTIGSGKNPNPGSFTVDAIKDKDNRSLYAAGEIYGNRALKLLSITVGGNGTEPRTQLERYVANGPGGGSALVIVEWEKYGADNLAATDATGAKVPIARFFNLVVTRNASGQITDCYAVGGTSDVLWRRTTANPSDIYFDEGRVGLGTATPASALDIFAADTGVGQSADKAMILQVRDGLSRASLEVYGGGDGTAFPDAVASAIRIRSMAGTGRALTTPGSIRAGNGQFDGRVDVHGGINPGSAGVTTGQACTGEGTFAYDMGAHSPVYCANTGTWKTLGAAAPTTPPPGTWGAPCYGGTGITLIYNATAFCCKVYPPDYGVYDFHCILGVFP